MCNNAPISKKIRSGPGTAPAADAETLPAAGTVAVYGMGQMPSSAPYIRPGDGLPCPARHLVTFAGPGYFLHCRSFAGIRAADRQTYYVTGPQLILLLASHWHLVDGPLPAAGSGAAYGMGQLPSPARGRYCRPYAGFYGEMHPAI